ncbi:MAG: hypothetical protein H5T84_08320, partial [Thermoleophilia bacterium]|nr:hypothetical protein [Thermoleophilia bacterium]
MRDPRRPRHARSLGERLLSPTSRLQPYRWVILAVGVVLEIVVILAVYSADAVIHPLDPAGSGIVLISVLVAGLGGALAGLASALV